VAKGEEQNLDGWEWEDRLTQDLLRSTSGRSSQRSTVVADDSHASDHLGAVADQPPADEGM